MNIHECDLLCLSKSGYATEVELKISRSDLLADKKKKHQHKSAKIKYLYFAVPYYLKETALECIPERAGLYVFGREGMEPSVRPLYYTCGNAGRKYASAGVHLIKKVRKAKINKAAEKWPDQARLHTAHLGAMRIGGLKKKIYKLKAK